MSWKMSGEFKKAINAKGELKLDTIGTEVLVAYIESLESKLTEAFGLVEKVKAELQIMEIDLVLINEDFKK